MADVTFDTSEVTRLAAQLAGAGARAVKPAQAAVKATAEAIQDDLRAVAGGGGGRDSRGRFTAAHRRFRFFPASITYDIRGLDAEIGPDKRKKQGALGNLLYFGTAKTGPTLEHPSLALQRSVPALTEALGAAAASAVLP